MLFPSLALALALWGQAWAQLVDDLDLPDVVAPVGRVFSLPLGSHAVYGDPRVDVKITLAGGPSLPQWLVFNSTSKLLAGVPLNADRASHILTVIGTCLSPGQQDRANKACSDRTDVFQLTVADLDWSHAWDAQDFDGSDNACDGERVVASLVLCASVDEIGAANRLSIAQHLAGFMSIPASSIKVEPSSTQSLVALHNGMQMVFAGPGSETMCDLGQNMEVIWALTCSSVKRLRDFAQVLQHNVDGGRLQGELGVSLVGWYVASSNSLRTRQGRRRRNVGHSTPTPSPVPVVPVSPTTSETDLKSSEVASTVSATATATSWSYMEPSSTVTPAYSTDLVLPTINPSSASRLSGLPTLSSSFHIVSSIVRPMVYSQELQYSGASNTPVLPAVIATDQYMTAASDSKKLELDLTHQLFKTTVNEILKMSDTLRHDYGPTSPAPSEKPASDEGLTSPEKSKFVDTPTAPILAEKPISVNSPIAPILPEKPKSVYSSIAPILPEKSKSFDSSTAQVLPEKSKSVYSSTAPILPEKSKSVDCPTAQVLPEKSKSVDSPTAQVLPEKPKSVDSQTAPILHEKPKLFYSPTAPVLPEKPKSVHKPTAPIIHVHPTSDEGQPSPTSPEKPTSDEGPTSVTSPEKKISDDGPNSGVLSHDYGLTYPASSDTLTSDDDPTSLRASDTITHAISPTSPSSHHFITSRDGQTFVAAQHDPLTSLVTMDSLAPVNITTTPPLSLRELLTPSLVGSRTLEIFPPSQQLSWATSSDEFATSTVERDLVVVIDEEKEVELVNAESLPGPSSESSGLISTVAMGSEFIMAQKSEIPSSTSVTLAASDYSSQTSGLPLTHVTQPFFQIMTHDQHTIPPTSLVTHDQNTTQPSYHPLTHDQNTTQPSYHHLRHDQNTTQPSSHHLAHDQNTTQPSYHHMRHDLNTTQPSYNHLTHDQHTTQPSYHHLRHDQNTTQPSYNHLTHDQHTTQPSYHHLRHDQNTTQPSYNHLTHDLNATQPSYHHLTHDQNTTQHSYHHLRHDLNTTQPSYHHLTHDPNTTQPSYHYLTHDQNNTQPSYHHLTLDPNTTQPAYHHGTRDPNAIHPSYHYETQSYNATKPHSTTQTIHYETHIKTSMFDQTITTTKKPSSKVTSSGRKKTSTITASTSQTTSLSTSSSDGYAAVNNRPFVNIPIKTIVGQAGKVLDYLIGPDVFSDLEDGDTRSLMLSLELPTRGELPSSYWLYLDSQPQVLRGLPLKEDLTLDNTSVYLVATDRNGLSDRTPIALQIVDPPRRNFTHSFIMTFDVNFRKFMEHRRNITRLVKKIGTYFGDSGAQSITVLSVRQGSFILSWTNHTLAGPDCPRDIIAGLYRHMNANINDLRDFIGLNLRLDSVTKEDLGACLLTTSRTEITTTTHLVSNKLDEGFSIWAHVVLPVLIAFLVFVLIILIIIFCNRRRRQNQAAINAEKEAISNDRNPIIFPDEIETDEPALQAKDPLILPSDLQTSNQSSPPDSPLHAGDSAQDVARSRHSRDCQDKEWVAAESRRKEEKSRRHSKDSSGGRKHSRDGGKKHRDRMSGVSASSSLSFDRPNNHYLDEEEASSRNNTLTSNKSTSSDKRNAKQPPPYWQSQTDPPPYRLPPPYLNNTTQV